MNLLAFKSLNGLAPRYLTELLQSYTAAKALGLQTMQNQSYVWCFIMHIVYLLVI